MGFASLIVVGAIVFAVNVSDAQQSAKMPRIGYVSGRG